MGIVNVEVDKTTLEKLRKVQADTDGDNARPLEAFLADVIQSFADCACDPVIKQELI